MMTTLIRLNIVWKTDSPNDIEAAPAMTGLPGPILAVMVITSEISG